MRHLLRASLLAGAAFSVMATSAYAQDEVTAVDDLVVTARRTEESLQRVPASVSAF